MSGTKVQWRGGTTAQHSSFTGAEREVTVDTDKKTLVVHDGIKQGGYPLASEQQLQDTINSLGSAAGADVVQSTGNSTANVMSQKAVTDALNNLPTPESGLGVGQTWQNVKSSRVKGTTYTNTTGKPIYVAIISYGETWAKGDLYVDGMTVDTANLNFSGDDVYLGFSAIVPAGSTYMFETWDSYISVYRWKELR